MIKRVVKENYKYALLFIFFIIVFYVFKNTQILSDFVIKIDNSVINNINNVTNDNNTFFYKLLTNNIGVYLPIILLILMLLFIKNKYYFITQLLSYLVAGGVSYVTKLMYARPRPEVALIDIPTSFSFPSGHTITSVVFYMTFCYLLTIKMKKRKDKDKKFAILMFTSIIVLLICFSRIYLGVHYFSDVIGGLMLSIPLEIMIINTIKILMKEKLK